MEWKAYLFATKKTEQRPYRSCEAGGKSEQEARETCEASGAEILSLISVREVVSSK